MDLLEVPLEAVAFRLYSLPGAAAGSVWAWAAVLAAALGLWGIRAVGSKPDASSTTPPPPLLPDLAAPAELPEPQADGKDAEPIASGCHVEGAGATKARFTAYYHGASYGVAEEDECEGEEGREEEEGVGGRMRAPWNGGWRWEGLAMRRRGDLGWHRHQDMTALNGSVVRLWDGGCTVKRRPRRTIF